MQSIAKHKGKMRKENILGNFDLLILTLQWGDAHVGLINTIIVKELSLHINKVNQILFILWVIKHLFSDGSGLFQGNFPPNHRAQMLTEWVDEYQDDISHGHQWSYKMINIFKGNCALSFSTVTENLFEDVLVYHGGSFYKRC